MHARMDVIDRLRSRTEAAKAGRSGVVVSHPFGQWECFYEADARSVGEALGIVVSTVGRDTSAPVDVACYPTVTRASREARLATAGLIVERMPAEETDAVDEMVPLDPTDMTAAERREYAAGLARIDDYERRRAALIERLTPHLWPLEIEALGIDRWSLRGDGVDLEARLAAFEALADALRPWPAQ